MSYNPNAPYGYGGYPGQQYQQAPPYNPNVTEYVQVTNYVQQPMPPPPQVNEVVIVENQNRGFGTVGTALAGVAVGMALEEALEF